MKKTDPFFFGYGSLVNRDTHDFPHPARGLQGSGGNATLCYRWSARTGETLVGPPRSDQGRRSNRPGKLSGERTASGVKDSGERCGETRSRRRDNDLRRKDRGGIFGRRCGVFTMPGCAMRKCPGRRGDMDGTDNLRHLPLRALHEELGGSFVPFAGWEMPVRYGPGVMAEHLWCREKAGLFDVSHMGQVMLPPDAAEALEALVPMDVLGLREGRQRYAFFTNDEGGLLDDLMIARHAEGLHLVVNAACAEADIAHLERHVPGVHVLSDRALLALQGPMAEDVLAAVLPDVAAMRFIDVARLQWQGGGLWVSLSGYTG